jgi:hypothetical protein
MLRSDWPLEESKNLPKKKKAISAMNSNLQIEDRASSSRSKHEGESSFGLCDRPSRTRDNSQRQLPTDQDYAVSTREYQTDQSSLKAAPTAAGPVLDKPPRQNHKGRALTRSLHIRPMHSLSPGRSMPLASCPKAGYCPTSRLYGNLN